MEKKSTQEGELNTQESKQPSKELTISAQQVVDYLVSITQYANGYGIEELTNDPTAKALAQRVRDYAMSIQEHIDKNK